MSTEGRLVGATVGIRGGGWVRDCRRMGCYQGQRTPSPLLPHPSPSGPSHPVAALAGTLRKCLLGHWPCPAAAGLWLGTQQTHPGILESTVATTRGPRGPQMQPVCTSTCCTCKIHPVFRRQRTVTLSPVLLLCRSHVKTTVFWAYS